MTNNVFMVGNVFYPHKDYNSFLGAKLTVLKLCNYGIVLAKVGHVNLEIVSAYFIVYEAYFVNGGFCRSIRVVDVYFVVYALISYL
jgi:hypothetical protein